jgi:hypothetical protein
VCVYPHAPTRTHTEATHGGRAAPSAAPKLNPESLFALGRELPELRPGEWHDLNVAVCPAETFTVSTTAACEVAAAVAGRPYGGSLKTSALYAGCVWSSVGSFYSNSKPPDPMNTGNPDTGGGQRVCTGAPDF